MIDESPDRYAGELPAPPELAKDEIAFGFRPGKDRHMNERRPMVAGNWKMYTRSRRGPGQGTILVQETDQLIESVWDEVEVVFAPPFTGLYPLSTLIELDGPHIKLGAQDVYWEDEGAFTGEVSPVMLADLGVDYVIVGHSERREFFGETDETVNKKVKAVFTHGMTPILCCGEDLDQHEAGETEAFVASQVRNGSAGLTSEQAAALVVAYEPIWAIGTGRTAVPEDANDVSRTIRATIGALFGPPAAMSMRVLYGGSVKPENAAMFFSEPDIDGALVGGAALNAASFADIVRAARR
jgi:triosephosphate isomerase (TIM)